MEATDVNCRFPMEEALIAYDIAALSQEREKYL